MTDDPLDRLQQALKRRTPAPSEAARDRALRVAQTNFANRPQGSADGARHTSDHARKRHGLWKGVTTMLMKLTTRHAMMASASVATIALAVAITGQLDDLHPGRTFPRTAPAEPPVAAPKDEAARPDADGVRPGQLVGRAELRDRRADDLAAAPPRPQEGAISQVYSDPAVEEQEVGRNDFDAAQTRERLAGDAAPSQAPGNAAPGRAEAVVAPDAGGLALSRRTGEADAIAAAPPSAKIAIMPTDERALQIAPESDTEAYPDSSPSALKLVAEEPVSTFSIDVDTASYAVIRSSLTQGLLPPRDAVRVEEMINYFDYAYPAPETREVPFRTSVSVAPTPWNDGTKLLHIGIQGYDLPVAERPPLNLVFLIDTSGSMQDANKLPLLVRSFKLLLDTLQDDDSVAIVTYAGSAGMALEPTPASETATILASLDRLAAGGSTAGQAGLQQAYALAEQMRAEGEVSRVILATDGDFNVGISDPGALKAFIADRRDSGTYLSVLGFGRGNYDDATMQALAQNGNGTAAYIDTLSEAQKVLVEEASGALFPIAGDVKIQVEFNPAQVSEYRLIGYETRALNREDFNNDAVDAGEIGAGHTVTALYEITPKGSPAERIGDLRYGQADEAGVTTDPGAELAFLKLRYKRPGEARSNLIETPILPDAQQIAPSETRFAAAVAGFGEQLRGSTEIAGWGYDDALALASAARGDDPFGYRAEFLNLVRLARVAR